MDNDSVTLLPRFEDFLLQAGAAICDKNRRYLMIAADISDFHYINVNYGYDAGDALLYDIARAAEEFIAQNRLLLASRTHSDHFLMLAAYDGNDTGYVRETVKTLKKRITDIISERAPRSSPNLNIGIYYIEDNDNNIVAAADKANVARRTGKGKYSIPYVVYTEHLMDIKENSAKILPIFDDSFKNEKIVVYLQPKISSETKRIVGAEALSRLMDADGNIISPGQFIAALEKSGKIVELDYYVLDFIASLINKWMDSGIIPVTISFNLSRIHFHNDHLVDDIAAIAKRHNVPPEFIEIEVTESVFAQELELIVQKVTELRDYGFKVSVDDFGSGYSSLNLIGVLPVDVVKLDRLFVKENLKTERGNNMIKGLIRILNQTDLEIVCEGVETSEEEAIMKDYGCTEVQGYLYDKPIPISEFEKKYMFR